MASSPRLVVFDLGGVVVRICRSWEEGCSRAGLPLRGMDRRDATRAERTAAVVEYQSGRIDSATFAQRISTILGGDYSPEEIMAVHEAWVIDEYPGIVEAIEALHRAGVDTAALSNTNESHWRLIRAWPALRAIRRPFASHELGLHKPDLAIYRALERSTGHAPEEILFFDDLPENVEGARRAGWRAERIDPAADPPAQVLRWARESGIGIGESGFGIQDSGIRNQDSGGAPSRLLNPDS